MRACSFLLRASLDAQGEWVDSFNIVQQFTAQREDKGVFQIRIPDVRISRIRATLSYVV